MAKKGSDGLTDNQRLVLDLSRLLKRPSEIATATGLGLNQVANIKSKLAARGYTLPRFKRTPQELLEALEANPPKPRKLKPVAAERQFCKCGLTLPCNNCCLRPEYMYDVACSRDGSVTGVPKTTRPGQELDGGYERFDSSSGYFNGGLDRPETGFEAGPGYTKDMSR